MTIRNTAASDSWPPSLPTTMSAERTTTITSLTGKSFTVEALIMALQSLHNPEARVAIQAVAVGLLQVDAVEYYEVPDRVGPSLTLHAYPVS
jgi:hypothetical protein